MQNLGSGTNTVVALAMVTLENFNLNSRTCTIVAYSESILLSKFINNIILGQKNFSKLDELWFLCCTTNCWIKQYSLVPTSIKICLLFCSLKHNYILFYFAAPTQINWERWRLGEFWNIQMDPFRVSNLYFLKSMHLTLGILV